MLGKLRLGPIVILPGADHELHLVGRLEVRNVFRKHPSRLAAARAFQIHDVPHTQIARTNVVRSAGLYEHGEANVAETTHQRVDVFLQQRLAAGDLDKRQFVARLAGEIALRLECQDNFVDGHRFSTAEGIGGVAIGATQIAAGQPDESTR